MSLDRDAWIAEARAVPITRPLERIRTRLVARSGELVGPCPVCGGDDRFAVNLRKGLFHCRRSGEGGDVIALTRYLEACDFHTACALLTGRPQPGQGPGQGSEDGPAETAEARAARQARLARRAEARARVTEAARRAGTPLVYHFVCLATSITLTLTNSYEDTTVADCDDPTGIPHRKSVLTTRTWGGRIAGQIAADHLDEFRADATSDTSVPYQFRIDPKDGVGAGAWTGRVFVENFEITKTNNGIVNFTSQFRGDGPLDWGSWA